MQVFDQTLGSHDQIDAGADRHDGADERPNELAVDVTDALLPGKTNTIAIRVNTSLNRAAAGGGLQGRVFLYAPLAGK